MIVMKFGGTSVGDAQRIALVLTLVRQELPQAPVLVSSAVGGTTDDLLEALGWAKKGEFSKAGESVNEILSRHRAIAEELLAGECLQTARERLDTLIQELRMLVQGVGLLREATLRTTDAVLSFGERMATTLLHQRALQEGLDVCHLDARELIETDDSFGKGQVNRRKSVEKLRCSIKPSPGKFFLMQGFIGATPDGVTTTLGRGGSDYTAALVGAALAAEEIQIWTDVDGIMTTDPRLSPDARPIPAMSYKEAGELAFFGAKVIHPATIVPAIEREIPIIVKNTLSPEKRGTRIGQSVPSAPLPRGITIKRDNPLLTLHSSRMLSSYGYMAKIFQIFSRYQTSVDLVTTSELSVSITLDDDRHLDSIVGELSSLGEVHVERGQAIVSLVGEGLWLQRSFLAHLAEALGEIPLRMLSLGSSSTSVSLVLSSEDALVAVDRLHAAFFRGS